MSISSSNKKKKQNKRIDLSGRNLSTFPLLLETNKQTNKQKTKNEWKKNYETCLASIDLLLFSGLVVLPPPAGLSSPPGSPKVKSFTNLTGWTKIEVSVKKLNLKSFILPPLPAQWDARSGWNHFSLVPGMRWNSAKQVYINCGNLLLSMQKNLFQIFVPTWEELPKAMGLALM